MKKSIRFAYRRRLTACLISLGLFLLLYNLSPGAEKLPVDSSQLLKVTDPNWKDGEISHYLLLLGTDTLGMMYSTITHTKVEARAAYQIRVLTQTDYQDEKTTDSILLVVNRSDLRPIILDRATVSALLHMTLKAKYTRDKVVIEAVVPQGPKKTEVNLPVNVYDNEQIIFLLRALPLKTGYRALFQDVATNAAQVFPVAVEVTGEEKVASPAGDFVCWKVTINGGGKNITAWYQKDKPKRLVKYFDKQGEVTLLLTRAN